MGETERGRERERDPVCYLVKRGGKGKEASTVCGVVTPIHL